MEDRIRDCEDQYKKACYQIPVRKPEIKNKRRCCQGQNDNDTLLCKNDGLSCSFACNLEKKRSSYNREEREQDIEVMW